MTAHRYWMLQNFTSVGGSFVGAAEMYLRAVSGTNLATSAVTASSEFDTSVPPTNLIDGNITTDWGSSFGGPSTQWVRYDLGTPQSPTLIYCISRSFSTSQSPVTCDVYYSDDNFATTHLYGSATFGAWSGQTPQEVAITPTASPTHVLATKGVVLAVMRAVTSEVVATKASPLAVYNFPADEVTATKAVALVVMREDHAILATKAAALAVVRGRIAHPSLTPWSFTIDDHTFVVWQLQDQTIVWQEDGNEWFIWGSNDTDFWNAQLGQNWIANVSGITYLLGGVGVSNVVCGDGASNALYFLDPDLNEDYSSLGDPGKPFKRVITGQLVTRSNDYKPLWLVDVQSSQGNTVDASNMTVTLEISDDQGLSYWSAGDKTVVVGDYSPLLRWTSLGSYTSPGRLLRLTDYGALKRIDDWNDDYAG